MNNTQKDNLFLSGGVMYLQPYLPDGSLGSQKFDMGGAEQPPTPLHEAQD